MTIQTYADLKSGITVHFYSEGSKFNTKVLNKSREKITFKGKSIKASLIDAMEVSDPANCRILHLSQQQVWANSSPSNIPVWKHKEFEKTNKRKISQNEILMDSLQGMASDFGAYRFEIL